jgi:hypothetical protein
LAPSLLLDWHSGHFIFKPFWVNIFVYCRQWERSKLDKEKQPELDVKSQQETRSFTIEVASGEYFTIEERIDALINIKRLMFFSATSWQKLSSYFNAFVNPIIK